MRIEESLNCTFHESLPEPKSFPSVEDDRIIEPVVQNPVRSPSLEANASELGYPKSLIEARGHLIEQVIGELNERTLRTYVKGMEVKQHCYFNEMKDRCQYIIQTMVDIISDSTWSYETKDFTKTKFYRRISCCNDLLIDGALIQNTILKPKFHSKGTPSPSWDKS
ncbi:hypothetical protein Tco_0242282 [Tanacetum coccineum]